MFEIHGKDVRKKNFNKHLKFYAGGLIILSSSVYGGCKSLVIKCICSTTKVCEGEMELCHLMS